MCEKVIEMQYKVWWQNKLTEESGFCVGEFSFKDQAEKIAKKLNEEHTIYIHFVTPWSCSL